MELTDGPQGTLVDMHIHTVDGSSDSMLDPKELPDIARATGLTGVNITEHDKIWQAGRRSAFQRTAGDIFVNFGMEVSTDLGHMTAIGLNDYLPGIRRAEKLREELDRVGGFLIVNHPFRHAFDPVTAMRKGEEPFDLTPEQAAELPVFKLVHAVEVANACNTPQENYYAWEVAQVLGVPGTGGSDAHSASGIGVFAAGFEKKLSYESEMLEELHAGRFMAVHRTPGGRVVRFEPGSLEAAEAEAAG